MCIDIINKFQISGDFAKAETIKNGHINDTFLVTFNQAGLEVKYIIRKINKYVFNDPEIVIRNTINVIEHISNKLHEAGEKEITSRVMTLIKSKEGKYYFVDENEDYWCAILYFVNSYTVDFPEKAEQARIIAKEFGKFQKFLIDDDLSKYKPSIPEFHDVNKRILLLNEAIKKSSLDQLKLAENEIELALQNGILTEKLNDLLKNNLLPIRITHNDTKINNVLLNKDIGEAICVIDLDTVMPGTVIYDFGDLVRTAACLVAEDEEDIEKVVIRIDFFDAIAEGYLGELSALLTSTEIDHLVYGAEIIIYEQAIRFLTDYLLGDLYYRSRYHGHNLVRARNQFALLQSVQNQRDRMEEIVNRYCQNKL